MLIGFPRALLLESSPKFALQIGGQLSEIGSHYTAHTGTQDVMLQPPDCWDYRCVPQYPGGGHFLKAKQIALWSSQLLPPEVYLLLRYVDAPSSSRIQLYLVTSSS